MSTLKTNTIQAATGTAVNVASGHVLNAAGHVIQTKSMTLTAATTASSNSYTDSGLTLDITPSSTSSKILITGFVSLGSDYFKNYLKVLRDGSDLDKDSLTEFLSNKLAAFKIPVVVKFLDSNLPLVASGKFDKPALRMSLIHI